MTNNDLRPPSAWESHEGILVANRAVFQDETTPISYESFKAIAFPETNTVSRSLLKERIETRVEEFRETLFPVSSMVEFRRTKGIIEGLELALDILEES